jgi:hypothetical protein
MDAAAWAGREFEKAAICIKQARCLRSLRQDCSLPGFGGYAGKAVLEDEASSVGLSTILSERKIILYS